MSSTRLYLFKSNEFEASMYEPTLKVAGAKAAAEERATLAEASAAPIDRKSDAKVPAGRAFGCNIL